MRAAPGDAATIPESADDANVEWVAEALAGAGVEASGLVAVELEPVGSGAGAFGDLTRLRLRYDHRPAGAPGSLILKLPSRLAVNRARAAQFRLDEREVRFYREVAPLLDLRVPRCYRSRMDSGSGHSGLLLEDLGSMRAHDQVVGIGLRLATTTVESLARAHAQWWEAPGLADLGWMPGFADPVMRQVATAYRDLWPLFVERFSGELPPGAVALGERIRDGFDELLDRLSRPPVTIAHGDFRLDNLFFGRHRTPEVAVIDWQLACRGRGVFDVAYLLGQSMTIDQRRRNEMSILRAWHGSLTRAGVGSYSFGDAVDDYRRAVLVCTGWTVAGTTLERDGERARALALTQSVRSFTAALDLEAEGTPA